MHKMAKNKGLILSRISIRYGGEQFQFGLTRLHFPLKAPFASTMNRAQGQLATKCEILLPKSVSTHGQIYVAFLRCGNSKNICVWGEQEQYLIEGNNKEGKLFFGCFRKNWKNVGIKCNCKLHKYGYKEKKLQH